MTIASAYSRAPLRDHRAVITGAGSGIGAAISRRLAADGAAVIVADRDIGAAETVAAGIIDAGGRASAFPVDVTNEDSVAELFARLSEKREAPSILVANAGIAETKGPPHELDLMQWQRVIDVNLTGVALTLKYGAAAMLPRPGSIIAMSSILGLVGQSGSTAYSAAKAGVLGLVRSAALSYASAGIRVNAVAPGYVDTPLLSGLPEAVREQMVARTPMGRLASASEIAAVVAFLAGPDSTILTGTCIAADGGYTAI